MSDRATHGGDGGATPPAARVPGRGGLFAALALLVAVGAGCSSTEFEPVDPGDRPFSISGYLDPAREVQWVRVGRVRPTLAPDPESFQASVFLVEVETGRRWPMRDSTFTFDSGYRAVNVWTDAPVEAGRRYRLEIEGDDGARASAEVTVPPRPETATRPAPTFAPARVTLRDVGRVENVLEFYSCRLPDGGGFGTVFSLQPDAVRPDPDARTVEVVVYWSEFAFECSRQGGAVTAAAVEATVLSDDWPDLRGLSFDEANLPRTSPNIQGGVGFFGAATTFRVPIFENVPTE